MLFIKNILLSIKVGVFLAIKELKHSNKWSTGLIIFIMMLTFLNLVGVRGILVGIIEGLLKDMRTHMYLDVSISPLDNKIYIEEGQQILRIVENTPGVIGAVGRYKTNGIIEANLKEKIKQDDESNISKQQIMGIDPTKEVEVSQFDTLMSEGEFLEPGDWDKIVLGSRILERYFPDEAQLKDVYVGDRVILKINGHEREVEVKGILQTKIDELAFSAFMVDDQLRSMIDRDINNYDSIAIKLHPGVNDFTIVDLLKANDLDKYGKVENFEDGTPKFVKDMIGTFSLLGDVIGGIGLAVSAITTFIIIFVNAVTQRKLIGIMKGIGINSQAIIFSYILQALFYGFMGIGIATIIIYTVLEPYVATHPFDFPFADGILLVPWKLTLSRAGILMIGTIIAGYVPAKMIVSKNTLDSILGR